METNRITARAFWLGLLAAALFAFLTVYNENVPPEFILTATQIPVLPYVLLVGTVLLINPLLRLTRRIRPFSAAEMMLVFIMGAVSSGISTFGLASQLIPMVSGLSNRFWNTEQSRWDVSIEPNVPESFFVMARGTRAAAAQFRDADARWREATAALRAARNVDATERDLARLRAAEAEVSAQPESAERMVRLEAVRREMRMVAAAVREAQALWDATGATDGVARVLADYPERVDRLKRELDDNARRLRDLKETVFRQIEVFRRGLPKELRAVPGFLYVRGEGLDAYRGRVSRLVHGRAALRSLREADRLLRVAIEAGRPDGPAVAAAIRLTRDRLLPIADDTALNEQRAAVADEQARLQAQVNADTARREDLQARRRVAPASRFDRLDREILRLNNRLADHGKQLVALKSELDTRLQPEQALIQRVMDVRRRLLAAEVAVQDAPIGRYPACRGVVRQALGDFRYFDASFRRFVAGDIPWGVWVRPLASWLVLILLSYVILMAFNVLIFRQWAHNEKVIYPLAELQTTLCGASAGGNEDGGVPGLYRSGVFWTGFLISFCVLGWNQLAIRQVVPGLKPIALEAMWEPYIKGSVFEGLTPNARFHLFFTLVGLTFLVPAKISHSLWMFQLVYMGELLMLVWLGYGVNEKSFPMNWTIVSNFRTAQGGGALLVFAALILWKCRSALLCGFAPRALGDLEADERREMRIASWVFVLGSVALVVLLTRWMGAGFRATLVFYVVVLAITIGLVRVVAEGGLLVFQSWFGPFHALRTLVGLDKAWTLPACLTPLVVYYTVLFIDIKTFIAPAMANALKVRDTVRLRRLGFHGAVMAGILGAIAVSLVTHLVLAYRGGADAMNWWFYSKLPPVIFDEIKTMAVSPVDTSGARAWLVAGAVLMAVLMFWRQRVFWMPHPIGLVMLVNPVMSCYWFSIFLGWLCKHLVNKYGDKETYARFRVFFIGLILGELVMCLFGADLNRNMLP